MSLEKVTHLNYQILTSNNKVFSKNLELKKKKKKVVTGDSSLVNLKNMKSLTF